MTERLPRLDTNPELRNLILPFCRLKSGESWIDPQGQHVVSVGDATNPGALSLLTEKLTDSLAAVSKPVLLIADPPYNFSVGGRKSRTLFSGDSQAYVSFTRTWISEALKCLAENAHLYIWLGADQRDGFQPLPEVMLMLREFEELQSRSLITMRNQRGYGTQSNWMSVRQELLYYTRGNPDFFPQYTDIPRLLKGYFKDSTSNDDRSRSPNIRPGNVWVDIQQVFYRMEENVPGSYAQKPLKSQERVILSSSREGDIILDPFSHSGTSALAAERSKRRSISMDIDPVFAELTIRRLELYRSTGKTGWQWENPFPEIDAELKVRGRSED